MDYDSYELDQIYSEAVEDYVYEVLTLTDNQLLLEVLLRVNIDIEDEISIVLRTIAKEELKKIYM